MSVDTSKLRFPGPSDRLTIIGPTGSGKTQAAMWHLSNAPFNLMPWVVIDPKREELVAQIEGASYLDFGSIPKRPGIYVMNPLPNQKELLNQTLLDIWENENIGVWIDEGLMFGDGDGVDAILTQGRSKHVPMIMLMQRPVWVSRFAISEATFIQYFGLEDEADRQRVRAFARKIPVDAELPPYHSYYYDVPRKLNFTFAPVPSGDKILNRINTRLDAMKKRKTYTHM